MFVQGMDTHSNILYVQENFPALSHLAHRTAATDKYRPETCCIIGNYYSLKAQHEKVSDHCSSCYVCSGCAGHHLHFQRVRFSEIKLGQSILLKLQMLLFAFILVILNLGICWWTVPLHEQ